MKKKINQQGSLIHYFKNLKKVILIKKLFNNNMKKNNNNYNKRTLSKYAIL